VTELAGRVALVTGASRGIGRAIALELAEAGADLVINARGSAALDAVAAEIRARGRDVEAVPADVATEAGVRLVVEHAVARFGRVDVLVNNAGKGSPKRLLDLTEEDWHASFELNFMAAVRLSLACVPLMRTHGGGRIVNISSRVGRQPDPYFAPYAAAKAALINFTKSLANAFSKDGVLANCVVPGLVRTEAVEEAARKSAEATGKTTSGRASCASAARRRSAASCRPWRRATCSGRRASPSPARARTWPRSRRAPRRAGIIWS